MTKSKTKRVKTQSSTKTTSQINRETNGWDVLKFAIDRVYNLFKLGKFISAVVLSFMIIIMIVALKYPNTALPELAKGSAKLFLQEKFYLIPTLAALAISLVGNIVQRIVYRKEIERLTAHRSQLVHGLEGGSLKVLCNHNSTLGGGE